MRERETHVHALLAREQQPAGRVQQQGALQRVEGAQHQEVHAAVVALGQQAVQGLDQARGDVPLEPVLQLEELAEGGVAAQVGEWELGGRFGRRCRLLIRLLLVFCAIGGARGWGLVVVVILVPVGRVSGQADLG